MATVLIVDNEEIVTRFVCSALEKAGHRVCTARSGAEADRVATQMYHLDVLIVNHRLGPDTGRGIAERVLRIHPAARVVHVSGYSHDVLESEGSLMPGSSYLQKPFTNSELQNHLSSILS